MLTKTKLPLVLAVLSLVGACGTTAGGGAGGSTAKQTVAAEGATCVPGTTLLGCLVGANVLMQCDPGTGLWAKVKECEVNTLCGEGVNPATGQQMAQCISFPPLDAGVNQSDAGGGDTVAVDTGLSGQDVPAVDVGVTDGGTPPVDSGVVDAGPVDSGVVDGGQPDAGPPDTGTADMGTVDTGAGDSGGMDASTPDVPPEQVNTNIPQPTVSCPSGSAKTSTYADHTIAYQVKTVSGGEIMHGAYEWKLTTQVLQKLCWQDNKRVGHAYGWHSDGGGKSSELYYNANGKLHGYQQTWHKNGQKDFDGHFKDGKCLGLLQRWHENGQLRSKTPCDGDGEVHGTYNSWHDNGAKAVVQVFVHGKAQGLTQAWWDNGQQSYKGIWNNGLYEGTHTEWHDTGAVSAANLFINGNGAYKSTHENGKVWSQGARKDSERHGVWDWWDDQGNKIAHAEFNMGSGPVTEWWANGKVRIQTTYKDDQDHGPYKEWFENGTLKSDGANFEGTVHGTWTEYSDQGVKAYTVCYLHGAVARFEPCTGAMMP